MLEDITLLTEEKKKLDGLLYKVDEQTEIQRHK